MSVINDMNNQLVRMHATADLALVSGPINFIEPLSVGTPTYLFMDTDVQYDLSALDLNIEIARRTGGFAVTYNQNGRVALPTTESLLGRTPENPAFVNAPGMDVSAFTIMLDQLYEVIHTQMLRAR